ncbi:UDP-N-acetylmuramoyl-L-alanine--D-glutamate ligase [Virgibacillus sp. 179-BFC.A HS]|uniref:UDP-N-acetylmuramoyl-L-alanine--D-glutamate ligase n=1 Tax=Tigheibacillus jepli TaxID=3035914 RepID=A0ABU5CI13_9BACI|nr:UDP-N-acetylmuramoyl-L-alanine--D-glutamate ligase [Virgibacillus sp. 179-BFC.A HS]MDY0405963.1 UDP-N-acetylmuramoyl-L-alanine--D-glutamate ligase [Virgibacillus sp. 179-BFC.A HS]
MNKLKDFPYSKILVLGLAKSGTAAARLLLENHKQVIVNDKNASETDEMVAQLRRMGANVFTGSHPLELLDGVDLIIKNPGIHYENPILARALEINIPIVTEVELVNYLTEAKIIGITGSNGKTTTTTLITKMLAQSDLPTKVAGNIGIVASETAQTMGTGENLVLELSSFQLEGTEKFRPHISVLLNIFSAHLDYHKTFENYIAAKSKIFCNQTTEDYVIYNEMIQLSVKLSSNQKRRRCRFLQNSNCKAEHGQMKTIFILKAKKLPNAKILFSSVRITWKTFWPRLVLQNCRVLRTKQLEKF